MPKAYGYIRVSSRKQIENDSPEVQWQTIKAKYKELAKRPELSGLEWAGAKYEMAVSAWKTMFPNRPAARELLELFEEGDVLIVTRMNRMFRRLKDVVLTLDLLQSRGVHVVFCASQLDLTTAIGRAMAQMIGIMSELESEFKREQAMEGNVVKVARGQPIGPTPPGLSWKRVNKNHSKMFWDKPILARLRLVRIYRDEMGLSYPKIAERLRKIGRSRVQQFNERKESWHPKSVERKSNTDRWKGRTTLADVGHSTVRRWYLTFEDIYSGRSRFIKHMDDRVQLMRLIKSSSRWRRGEFEEEMRALQEWYRRGRSTADQDQESVEAQTYQQAAP